MRILQEKKKHLKQNCDKIPKSHYCEHIQVELYQYIKDIDVFQFYYSNIYSQDMKTIFAFNI